MQQHRRFVCLVWSKADPRAYTGVGRSHVTQPPAQAAGQRTTTLTLHHEVPLAQAIRLDRPTMKSLILMAPNSCATSLMTCYLKIPRCNQDYFNLEEGTHGLGGACQRCPSKGGSCSGHTQGKHKQRQQQQEADPRVTAQATGSQQVEEGQCSGPMREW